MDSVEQVKRLYLIHNTYGTIYDQNTLNLIKVINRAEGKVYKALTNFAVMMYVMRLGPVPVE